MSWLKGAGKDGKHDLRLQNAIELSRPSIKIADESYNIVVVTKSMLQMMKDGEQDLRNEIPSFDVRNLIEAGSAGRMQAALATAVQADPDWKEF
jgi:hypothetical protein